MLYLSAAGENALGDRVPPFGNFLAALRLFFQCSGTFAPSAALRGILFPLRLCSGQAMIRKGGAGAPRTLERARPFDELRAGDRVPPFGNHPQLKFRCLELLYSIGAEGR